MKTILGIVFCSWLVHAHAYQTARIDDLEVNATLRINQGRENGLEIGDPGVLLRVPYASEDRTDFVVVAYAEAVRVSSRESYWYLRDVKVPEDLRRTQGLILVRRKFRNKDGQIKERKVVGLTNNYDVAFDDLERKVPGGLSNRPISLPRYQGGVTDSAHEIFGFYTLDLYDHRSDADTTQDAQGVGFEVGYELSFERFSKTFDHFSIIISYQRYKNLLGLEGLNLENREESYRLLFNWYMRHPSGTTGKILPYIGAGYKRGNSDISHRTFSLIYDYALEAKVSFEIGAKYRFKVGRSSRIGFRAKLGYDRNEVFRRDFNGVEETPRDFVFDDLRFGLGLSYYF